MFSEDCNSVEFTPQEQKAYEELKRDELYTNVKCKAMQMIHHAFRLSNFPSNRENIKDEEQKIRYIRTLDHFKQSLNVFRTHIKFVLLKEQEISAENILFKLDKV